MARAGKSAHMKEQAALPEADKEENCPHPRTVYSLIGHEGAEEKLAKLVNSGDLHHAWLISGPKGVGKASFAYRLIRTVLGGKARTTGRLDVPKSDAIAQRIEALGHGDFLLIRRPYDEKTKKIRSEIPVAEARRIGQFFSKKASEGGWRVCLIDGIDDMNANAANAVLKTLEEPPKNALLILLSNTPGKLLPTIRSRCMSLSLRAVAEQELRSWLEGKIEAEQIYIDAAIKLSSGAPGKALAYLQAQNQVLKPLKSFIESFPNSNSASAHSILAHSISDDLSLASQALSHDLFWDGLIMTIDKQAIYAAFGEWEGAFSPLAIAKPVDEWARIKSNLMQMRAAQTGLNMNKKQVLLQALLEIG